MKLVSKLEARKFPTDEADEEFQASNFGSRASPTTNKRRTVLEARLMVTKLVSDSKLGYGSSKIHNR